MHGWRGIHVNTSVSSDPVLEGKSLKDEQLRKEQSKKITRRRVARQFAESVVLGRNGHAVVRG